MLQFVKATLIGGLVFLLPLIVLSWVSYRAVLWTANILHPMALKLGFDKLGPFGGYGFAAMLAVVILLALSLAAGMFATMGPGRRVSGWLERSVLDHIPQYRSAKSVMESLAEPESHKVRSVALLGDGDTWQPCFLLEELDGGWVTVLVPQAPTPMGGNILFVRADRLKMLDMPTSDGAALVRARGLGASKFLQGVDLSDEEQISH